MVKRSTTTSTPSRKGGRPPVSDPAPTEYDPAVDAEANAPKREGYALGAPRRPTADTVARSNANVRWLLKLRARLQAAHDREHGYRLP